MGKLGRRQRPAAAVRRAEVWRFLTELALVQDETIRQVAEQLTRTSARSARTGTRSRPPAEPLCRPRLSGRRE